MCIDKSSHLGSDQSSMVSSPTTSDQLSSTSVSSSVDNVSSCGRVNRRHSLPPLRGNHAANPRQLSKSASEVLRKRRTEHRSSESTSYISNSLNDSGCNSSGSDTSLDQTENRPRLRSAEAAANDTPHLRDELVNDSGYHNTMNSESVDFDATSIRGSNSESETRDDDGSKKGPVKVHDLNIGASNLHAAECGKSDSEMSGPVQVVLRRTSSAAKCQQNCAADGDKVVTRKLRRSSMMVRQQQQQQQQDKVVKTRRRHSFMLPNGSDIYPTLFSAEFTWPTIVEEDVQLTGAASDEKSAKQFPKKCDAGKDNPFADLVEFRARLKNGRQSADVDSSKLDAAPSAKESRFLNDGGFTADFPALGAKLRSGLQLARAESGQMNSELTLNDCDTSVSEEGTFADLKALGVELGKATSAAKGAAYPSPPLTRNPPSYDEALLHKALRRSDLIEAERILTYRSLTDARGPAAATAHLLTSSTYGDVTVRSAIGADESDTGYRRPPPPPYQLRPRRQNYGEDEIHNPWKCRPIQRASIGENVTGRDSDGSEGQQSRKNKSEPAIVRVVDRNAPDLRRSSSFPSPRRRRRADSAQKENVGAGASTSPRSAVSVTPNTTAGPSSYSTSRSVDATKKTSRNSVSLKRRSLTVRDRDWHRELVDQYGGAGTPRNGSMSTTACDRRREQYV